MPLTRSELLRLLRGDRPVKHLRVRESGAAEYALARSTQSCPNSSNQSYCRSYPRNIDNNCLRCREENGPQPMRTDTPNLQWHSAEGVYAEVPTIRAILELDHPAASPYIPRTSVNLDVEDHRNCWELDDEHECSGIFAWRVAYTSPDFLDEAEEIDRGDAPDMASAQRASAVPAITFLRDEGWNSSEISAAFGSSK